jgi:hypothetical protein
MTTPAGTPDGSNPVAHKGFDTSDAHAQASPMGGGQFTGGSEAKVIGTDQDKSATGQVDLHGQQAAQTATTSMAPGKSQFTSLD